jgi:hypothetical protein
MVLQPREFFGRLNRSAHRCSSAFFYRNLIILEGCQMNPAYCAFFHVVLAASVVSCLNPSDR